MDSTTVDLIMKDLKEQTSLIRKLNHKLSNAQKNVKELKKRLLEICPHTNIIHYRYYDSGMHRPEYRNICKKCDQYVSFDQYIKAETTEDRDG